MKYVIIWTSFALVIGCITGLNIPFYYHLEKKGVTTHGKVTGIFPNNHETLSYEYTIGDQIYKGQMQSRFPNPEIDQIKIGQDVFITYDPDRPESSILGDPNPILKNELNAVIAAMVLGSTFITLVIAFRFPSKRVHQKRNSSIKHS